MFRRTKGKYAVLCATLMYSGAAYGQTIPQTTPTQPPVAEDGTTLGDIVVTAQRREERLKDVPVTVTSVTASQLATAGVTSTLQLTSIVPGLNFTVQAAYVQPTIRGIGTSVTGAGADANVSIYIDGVYQPSQLNNAFQFNNIDRIEVLKGPQGTLFGRNATGGAILITTRQPSFSPSGELSLGYGAFDEVRVKGYVTTPVVANVAADLAIVFDRDRGFAYNTNLNRRTARARDFAARSKILWKAGDDLSFTLAGSYINNSDNTASLTKPLNGNNVAFQTNPALVIPADIHTFNTDTDANNDNSEKAVSLTVKYTGGPGVFSSISSYNDSLGRSFLDSDVTSIPSSSNNTYIYDKTFTQEFTYTSKLSPSLDFLVGAYLYSDNALRTTTNSRGQGGVVTNQFSVRVKTGAVAAFGELYLRIADGTRLTAGVRLSSEKKTAVGAYSVGVGETVDSSRRWNAFTPRVSIVQELSPTTNVYATFSKGFKSGSYNTSALSGTPVNPENVTAYEVGIKSSASRLVANLSAFYYNYKDIQVQIITNTGGVSNNVLQNAADARIYGLDGDVTALLSDAWKIRLGAAWTHGRYITYPNALLTTPRLGGGNTQFVGDASGNRMIRSPDFMGSGTLTYNRELFAGKLVASTTASYTGLFYWDPGNRVKQSPYTLISANLSWTNPDKTYRIEVWGTNLTDVKYYYYASVSTTGDSVSYQRPRSYGVTATRYF